MRQHVRWMSLALPFLVACPQDAGDGGVEDAGEDLTVVVEADKSQILQQEERLKESQSSLEQERERLTKAREDVLGKISSLSKKDRKRRRELEAEQTRLAREEEQLRNKLNRYGKERDELERKKTDLIARIGELTGEGGGGKTAIGTISRRVSSIEEKQKEILAVQNKNTELLTNILEAVKSIDGGTRTVVHTSAPAPSGGGSSSKGQVTRLEANIRAKMRAKGILVADLPPAARDYRSAGQKASEQRDWSTAYEAFTQLDAVVSSIKVGHTFVQAKFGRINKEYEGKMKQLNPKKKSQVLALLDDVSDSFSDGRYDKANRKINQIHSLLEGR